MNTWQELFILSGVTKGFIGNQGIQLNYLGDKHIKLLMRALKNAKAKFVIKNNTLEIESNTVHLTDWMKILETVFDTREGWYKALNETQLIWIDPYMIGVVAQLNRLGYVTNYSCSGHGRREGSIAFRDHRTSEISTLFNSIGARFEVIERFQGLPQLNFPKTDEHLLPYYALQLAKMQKNITFCIKEDLNHGDLAATVLKDLLELPGKSGEEHKVRAYLINYLAGKVDSLQVDQLGNIFGTKRYGYQGQTVLLSAHMDIYDDFDPACKINIEENIWRRPGEILGADDRVGVAMILMLLHDLENSGFDGTIKFAFTVQEECGRIGASVIPNKFLADVDYAIVLDRRGSGDIVTNCNGIRYCTTRFEHQVERIISDLKFSKLYKPVSGGISDITVWSSHGIDSINVSIGFYREHTIHEYFDISDWMNSKRMAKQLIKSLKFVK